MGGSPKFRSPQWRTVTNSGRPNGRQAQIRVTAIGCIQNSGSPQLEAITTYGRPNRRKSEFSVAPWGTIRNPRRSNARQSQIRVTAIWGNHKSWSPRGAQILCTLCHSFVQEAVQIREKALAQSVQDLRKYIKTCAMGSVGIIDAQTVTEKSRKRIHDQVSGPAPESHTAFCFTSLTWGNPHTQTHGVGVNSSRGHMLLHKHSLVG